ncbi:MAG: ATP phosphoribosyltransferase [Rubricella sp.]
MTTLRLGLPSKGRLQDDAMAWFAKVGITIRRTGSGREYSGAVDGIDGISLVLLSAAEIPRELAAGRIHLGVTGQDLVHERIPAWEGRLAQIAEMGFGHADLIVAVPDCWRDCETMDDLDAVAHQFRARHGHRLRVATKYHNLVRGFFRAWGVADWRIVDSQGATEGTIRNGTAEVIADITSSGETLRANHLRILTDGLILRSQATLFASRGAEWSDPAAGALRALCDRLGIDPPDI